MRRLNNLKSGQVSTKENGVGKNCRIFPLQLIHALVTLDLTFKVKYVFKMGSHASDARNKNC